MGHGLAMNALIDNRGAAIDLDQRLGLRHGQRTERLHRAGNAIFIFRAAFKARSKELENFCLARAPRKHFGGAAVSEFGAKLCCHSR